MLEGSDYGTGNKVSASHRTVNVFGYLLSMTTLFSTSSVFFMFGKGCEHFDDKQMRILLTLDP